MKFLHTADWQIGMKVAHAGAAGERARAERLSAAGRVIESARRYEVDFILVAGDTFEDNGVNRILVQKTADILDSFEGPVFVIPGNHDHPAPGSVWEHPAWAAARNVRVLRDAAPVEVPGGILYPCPVRDKYSQKDPTAWIADSDRDVVRIGMAHGTMEGIAADDRDHPIPRNAASRSGLDYLALGHWHSTAQFETDGVVRTAYSGSHETTAFGERDSGAALIVGISGPGAPPSIVSVRTGGLRWLTARKDLRAPGDLRELRESLERIPDPASCLMQVLVAGLLHAEELEDLKRIEEILGSRFLFGRLDTSGVRPAPEDASWRDALPVGILREVASRLQALTDAPRPDSRPETASRALLELYALISESLHDRSIDNR